MIMAHKRARQLCVCFLSSTLCGKVKGGLTTVRGTCRLVVFSFFLDATVQFLER